MKTYFRTGGENCIWTCGTFYSLEESYFSFGSFSEIVKIEPKAEFILVGRGGLEDKIKRKVQDMKLVDKVHFLGVREDIPELMIMMDGLFFLLFTKVWEL